MHPPKVFISATSGDLRSVRQMVKECLLTINCHPVEQTNFEPDARTVENLLRGKISDCQALIHICGMRYGAEPEAASLPPGTPRRSYTQLEYHIARQLQEQRGDELFRVYTFICPEDFPYDEEPDTEPQEKRDLQRAHRSRLFDDPHLREKPKTPDDLKLRILALQEEVLALKQEQAAVKTEITKNRRLGIKAFAIILLLLGGISGGIHFIQRGQQDLKKDVETLPDRVEDSIRRGYTVDAVKIRIQLEAASKQKLDADLVAANDIAKHPKWDDRQKLREDAEAAHQLRISRVSQYAEGFADLAAAQDASPVLVEMARIIETEGVDAALAYFESQRGDVFKRAKSRLASAHDAVRRELQPSLKAAGLMATKGDTAAARAAYEEVLAIEPDWPEALEAYAWFLHATSSRAESHGSLIEAMNDAQQMFALATRHQSVSSERQRSLRLTMSAGNQLGDVLLIRGNPGDANAAGVHYEHGLKIAEELHASNPDSVDTSRDLSLSLGRLGGFFADRGRPGDPVRAFEIYQQSLRISEKLFAVNPRSRRAASDLSGDLMALGRFLELRGQAADVDRAIGFYERGLKLEEDLYARCPDSRDNARGIHLHLNEIGDLLRRRGNAGDDDKALGLYQRALAMAEEIHAATPHSAQSARDLYVNLNDIADILAEREDAKVRGKALQNYQRALGIAEKLVETNPDSTVARRDVAFSLCKVGDFLFGRNQKGDSESSHRCYLRALEISERIRDSNPNSVVAAKDVSSCLFKIGCFHSEREDPASVEVAIENLQRALDIDEKLLACNQDSASLSRSVAIGLNGLGKCLSNRGKPGDLETASAHYQRSLELFEELMERNPNSANAVRDVSVSLNELGQFLARSGRPGDEKKSREYYERSVVLAEKLLADNPNSPEMARVLSENLERLGDSFAESGRPGDAEKALVLYQRSLATREKLLKDNPNSAEAAMDAILVLNRLGDSREERGLPGDLEKALHHGQRSVVLAEQLLAANPDSAEIARAVSVNLVRIGDLLAERGQPGDTDKAFTHYQRALGFAEKLHTAKPGSAEAALDVCSVCLSLAELFEQTKQGDASAWWRRANEVLDGLEKRGVFLPPEAKEVLEFLRAKLGDRRE